MGRWKRELQNGSFCIINKTWPIWIAVFVCQPNTTSDIPLPLDLSFSLSLSLCQPPMPTLVNMLWRKLEIHVSEYTARKDKKKAVCPWILKWGLKRSNRRCRRENCTRNKFAKTKCNCFFFLPCFHFPSQNLSFSFRFGNSTAFSTRYSGCKNFHFWGNSFVAVDRYTCTSAEGRSNWSLGHCCQTHNARGILYKWKQR